jgi:hypothetical protein
MRYLPLLLLAGCQPTQPIAPIDFGVRDMALNFQNPGPVDMAQPPNMNPGGPDDMAMGMQQQMGCTAPGMAYAQSTISTMRQAKSGCFELDNVVTIATTPVGTNTKSVSIHVQDAAGGDYSAIKLDCSSTSMTHMCAAFTSAKSILAGRKVTVQGLYIKSSQMKGGFEIFYIDNISDGGAATAPAPATLMEGDLQRGASMSNGGKPMAAYWFQMVTANISDKLLMFDWSAPEFKRSGSSTSCPQQFGFGMIPTSAGATAGSACNGMTQPSGQSTVNAKEILVSTDYYGGFKFSSDCACAGAHMDPIPTSGQGVTGSITALLDYDVVYGQTTGYQYLAPLDNASFNIK